MKLLAKSFAVIPVAIALASCSAQSGSAESTTQAAPTQTAAPVTVTQTVVSAVPPSVASGGSSGAAAPAPATKAAEAPAAAPAPASAAAPQANDQHQAPEHVVERCQPGRVAAEVGRSEAEAVLTYCDGAWAKYGKPGTEQLLFARWDGARWKQLKADGMNPAGACFQPETVATLAPPAAVSLPVCKQ